MSSSSIEVSSSSRFWQSSWVSAASCSISVCSIKSVEVWAPKAERLLSSFSARSNVRRKMLRLSDVSCMKSMFFIESMRILWWACCALGRVNSMRWVSRFM